MEVEAAALTQLVLSTTWTCLADTPFTKKNPLFARFFTSQAALEEVASTASITFFPTLLEVLQSSTPPTIQVFKSLPQPTGRYSLWGVYILVLEKPGCQSRIYIGSGTSSGEGVRDRFTHYDAGTALPRLVGYALNEGYTIVHKALLCWIPIPTAATQPIKRLLFVALEAVFAYIFWAMRPHNADFGMGHISPWDRSAVEYDGLCSHCSLNEGIVGDFDLSAEELEAQAIQRKEMRATKQAAINANYHYKQMATNRDEYLDTNAARRRDHQAQNVEKYRERERAHNAKHKANQTYYCQLCKVACHKKSDLDVHNKTRKHLRKAADLADPGKHHRCIPCAYATDKLSTFKDHLKSQRHQKMAALSSSSLD